MNIATAIDTLEEIKWKYSLSDKEWEAVNLSIRALQYWDKQKLTNND